MQLNSTFPAALELDLGDADVVVPYALVGEDPVPEPADPVSRRTRPLDPLTRAEAVTVPRAARVAAQDLHPVGCDLVLKMVHVDEEPWDILA